jgi:hypothetical protein
MGNRFAGRLHDCFYCLSLWVAAPFAYFVGESARERLYLWLAFTGGAILLERVTSREAAPFPLVEEGGETDAMLRKSEKPVADDLSRSQTESNYDRNTAPRLRRWRRRRNPSISSTTELPESALQVRRPRVSTALLRMPVLLRLIREIRHLSPVCQTCVRFATPKG